ncbi:hypothetical protein [Streptomyces rimosus]|uniref:hypothetical protein n=1 Tax=Streptomyces rimosus TaxID=1927 RepID=UPI00099C07EE|nr:hypothetical protein [Streptomyces rimosus]
MNIDSRSCAPTNTLRGAEKRELRREPPGGGACEPDGHGLGRSRGGLTTKPHLVVEQDLKPRGLRAAALAPLALAPVQESEAAPLRSEIITA